MTQKLTVLSPVVKIRRGPNAAGAKLREAKNGQQYEILQLIPGPKAPEQWAKIVLPDMQNVDAYICTVMATGTRLCAVEDAAPQVTYADGFRDGVEHVLRMIAAERAKFGS